MLRDDDITHLLAAWQDGNDNALNQLLPLVYSDLRAIAARKLADEIGPSTLQPTALVHDVFVRLLGGEAFAIESRAHLFNIAARVMRRILVDRARTHEAERQAGMVRRVDLVEAMQLPIPEGANFDLLDAAVNGLEEIDPRLARIVELRYFVGLSVAEVASVLEVDERTVYRDWALARVWLRRRMEG